MTIRMDDLPEDQDRKPQEFAPGAMGVSVVVVVEANPDKESIADVQRKVAQALDEAKVPHLLGEAHIAR